MTKEEVIDNNYKKDSWVFRTKSDRLKAFIDKSNIIHNNKYNYSKCIYFNALTKVSISCDVHGIFNMKPNAHMNGQGCPLCGKERTHESHRYNNETFILKASNKHNNFYSYNKTNYINSKDKVVITCPHHGDFTQTPAEHLRGFGCMECGRDKTLKARKSDSNTFIQKSILKHGTLYSYNNVKYINSSTKVIITCPEHGDFKQAPNSHLMGQGCPECSCLGSIGWMPLAWKNYCKRYKKDFAYLYVINMFGNGESFIKIGITTDTISNRFIRLHKYGYKYNIIIAQRLDSIDAFSKEKCLHKKYREQKYIPKIKYPGYTESFNINIISDFQI